MQTGSYPPTVRLSQAFEPEKFSGGASGSEITRRSFLKRTGGATVATLVAWNFASQNARADGGSESVTASVPSKDLGIDTDGYRNEAQKLDNNKLVWRYNVPNKPMTLPHDPAQAVGVAPPNELTINIKVTPANAAGAVSFRRAGDEPDCLAFVGNPVVKGNGVIELKIQAVTPSTPANGGGRKPNGTLIEAVHNNKVIGIGKYYVIKPASIKTGTPGQIILEMSAKPAEVGTFRLRAEYEGQCVDPGLQQHQAPPATFPPAGQPGAPKYYVEFIPIEILDQYNMPLGGMYSDTAVREGGTWMAWMGSGSYLDPQGCGGNKVSDGYIEIYVAGYYCGDCNTRLTIANDNGTTADFKVEWL